jgi:hypothetical protein
MTSFQDKFGRADGDLDEDNGWNVIAATDVEAGQLEIKNRHVTNTTVNAPAAFQETEAPTTNEQEVSAWITSTAQGTNNYIDLIINGAHATAYGNRSAGVKARLHWDADSARTLSIFQEDAAAASYTTYTAATLSLVAAGGTVGTDYHGQLIEDGALGTLQHVRMIVREKDYGLEAAVYVNQGDDDAPTLVAQLRTDLVAAVGTAGHWGFELGAAVAETLIVAEFQGKDYAPGIAVDSVLKTNHPSLLELREAVKLKFSRGGDTDLEDHYVDEIIAEEVEALVLELGDIPWFLIRKGNVALTIDTEGFCTMPSYMEHVHGVERLNRKTPSDFTFETMDDDGDLILRFNTAFNATGETYIVKYLQRWYRMDKPDDLCVIPRRHKALIVYAAAEKIALTGDRMQTLSAGFRAGKMEKLRLFKAEQGRYFRKTRTRFRPRRRATATPFTHQHRRW